MNLSNPLSLDYIIHYHLNLSNSLSLRSRFFLPKLNAPSTPPPRPIDYNSTINSRGGSDETYVTNLQTKLLKLITLKINEMTDILGSVSVYQQKMESSISRMYDVPFEVTYFVTEQCLLSLHGKTETDRFSETLSSVRYVGLQTSSVKKQYQFKKYNNARTMNS
jgi:hypothetical protein